MAELMDSRGQIVVLIKPQFEANREDIKEGGIVDDSEVHQEIIENIKQGANFCLLNHWQSVVERC